MKAFIVRYPFGIIAFDEEQKIIAKTFFHSEPQEAARAFLKLEAGIPTPELTRLTRVVNDAGYGTVVMENSAMAQAIQKESAATIEISETGRTRISAQQAAVEAGFSSVAEEYNLWTRNFTVDLAKLRVKGAVEQKDLVVAQTIQTLDDLDRMVNQLMGRLREWYGVHFPELDRLVEKHETYARLVLELGARETFSMELLEKASIPKGKAEAISELAENSMGAGISDSDLLPIQTLAKNILELYSLRQNMESYVNGTMEEVAPNIKSLVGALLGARLIAISGSLRNLAMRPASTIQVLGAEKALFRSLKTGARPPKHGLIFQAALLHDAKNWQRGKIARALAGKLSIAARADAFGGRYVGDRLKADLERRMEEIKEKYKDPPPIKERKPTQEQRRFGERRAFRDRRGDRNKRWQQSKWRKDKRAHKG